MKPFHSRHLHVQLYVAMLASTFGCLLLVGVAFRVLRDDDDPPTLGHHPGRPPGAWIDQRPDGEPMRPGHRWRRHNFPVHPFFATLMAMAAVMAVASYPIARRLTRRLQLLAAGVERWGGGELAHRLPVEGADEVATLAGVFNQAATRVDLLLAQQRQLLASTSHELRSPLARMRLGLDLMLEESDPTRRQQRADDIRRDIVELDALIEELLLFARADSRVPRRPFQPVGLRALAVSEVERACPSAQVIGDEVEIAGDALLLRHLIRNLIENAVRHGGAREVRVRIEPAPDQVVLAVEDGGPGVPTAEQERIFTPFYRRAGSGSGSAAGAGHGVGLALVRQVALYHGGEAHYGARASGGGSRFTVSLPRHRLTNNPG